MQVWSWVASPGACVIAAVIGLLALIASNKHKRDASTVDQSIVAVILLSGVLYTLLILIVGQFFLRIPVANTIQEFGSERMAWVSVGLAADVFARLYRLFHA
jgi:hypothetical protein